MLWEVEVSADQGEDEWRPAMETVAVQIAQGGSEGLAGVWVCHV